MRILYVEDNPANVFLVKRVAKMGNHEIINYIDGDQALSKFDEVAPDLVLMDIQLAGEKSGLDVVRELRQRGTDVPIVAVTAYAMVGDRERCIEAGCTDYMAKPLPIPRLVELFQEHSATKPTKVSVSSVKTAQEDAEAVSASTDQEIAGEAQVEPTKTSSSEKDSNMVAETAKQPIAGEAPIATSTESEQVKSDDETVSAKLQQNDKRETIDAPGSTMNQDNEEIEAEVSVSTTHNSAEEKK